MNQSQSFIQKYRIARTDSTRVVVEGFHALKHAIRFGAQIEHVAQTTTSVAMEIAQRIAPDLVPILRERVEIVDDVTFAQLAPYAPRTGIIAIAQRPQYTLAHVCARQDRPIIVADDLRDLENIGAVIRVAAAADASGVYVRSATIDPWHPACVRGSAGLHFAMPILGGDELPAIPMRPIIVCDERGENLMRAQLPHNAVIVVGSERFGVSSEIRARASRTIRIPMRTHVSSLNVATSVAAMLYGGHFCDTIESIE